MNIGFAEILVILVFALIIVGPDKLPKFGKTVGKAIAQFRDAQNKVNETVNEFTGGKTIKEMQKNPFLALDVIGNALENEDKEAEKAQSKESSASDQQASLVEQQASSVSSDGSGASGGSNSAEPSGPSSAGPVDSADTDSTVDPASSSSVSAENSDVSKKLIPLSDMETFTERKLRLKANAMDSSNSSISNSNESNGKEDEVR